MVESEWRPAMSPSRLSDVAEAAGVSRGTVSNVLNAPHKVSLETRERVNGAIKKLNFTRNESARQLSAGKSRSVGLIVPDIRNPFFTEAARAVQRRANEAGMVVLLCDTDGSQSNEDRYLEMLLEQRASGVIITPVNSEVNPRLLVLRQAGSRVVLLSGAAPGFCSVRVDDQEAARRAVHYLLSVGHREIAVVTAHTPRQEDRRRGADLAIKQFKDGAGLQWIRVPSLDITAGRFAADMILKLPIRPTAVFCGNDRLAFGVLNGLAQAKVSVPRDISVVGFDDVDYAAAASPPLSTVQQLSEALGTKAVELLLDEDLEDHEHQQIIYDTQLVLRDSSAPLRGPQRRRRMEKGAR